MLRELRKRQCEDSLYEFTKDAFLETHPGEEFLDNWHIKYLCDRLQQEAERFNAGLPKIKDIVINIPPRSLKSFITVIAFPAWWWIHNNYVKFISTSFSKELSTEHNVMTRDIINSEWYQSNWGDKVRISDDENTKTKFKLVSGGSRRATSTGGTITGSGGDCIAIDDSTNPKKAASELERTEANTYYDSTLNTRLDRPDKGFYIIIMQRLHEDDLTGHVMNLEPNRYDHICIPAELSKYASPPEVVDYYEDDLFFPKRFTRQFLDAQKISLGSMQYAGQYGQAPAAEGGTMIKSDWFGLFDLSDLPRGIPWNFAVDSAYTKDNINDASALMAFCRWQYDLYIRDVTEVFMEFPDLIKFIKEYAYRNGYSSRSRIFVEPKASGLSAIQTLKKFTGLNVVADDIPTTDKIVRVNAALPFLESRRAWLLRGAQWIEPFFYQTGIFPNGKQDGMVDTLCMATDKVRLRQGRVKYHFGTNNYIDDTEITIRT